VSDVAVVYTLTTPGGTIVFNNGADPPSFDDMFYITNIRGLDMGTIRAPQDDLPQDDGGLDHNFFFGPMHPIFEGAYLIQSTRRQTDIQILRNTMNGQLKAALTSILRVANIGTLSWTEAGQGGVSLPVRCEIPLETDGVELKTWTFGLYSSQANPA
jgi:hypothetical protein